VTIGESTVSDSPPSDPLLLSESSPYESAVYPSSSESSVYLALANDINDEIFLTISLVLSYAFYL
jgi:hypothetical protein